jgi:2-polyprenyl-3-methyl-5-hydroxy-6-metoxy-1,4-benzoquinol methylase
MKLSEPPIAVKRRKEKNIGNGRKAKSFIRVAGEAPPVSRVSLTRAKRLPQGSRSLQVQAKKVRGYILGNQAAWIAAIGLKTGLFRAVCARSKKGVSEDALSKDTGFDLRAVRAWCRSAYAFGFLEWEEESGYRLGPHMEELLLNPNHPAYQGGQIEFYAALNESYRRYPQFLRSGENDKGEGQDPWLLTALRNLTKPDAHMITDYVLPQAPRTLARVLAGGKILDIGSGEGFHLIHYARRYPRSRVIGLELDHAKVETARKNIAEAFLGERVSLREGDVNQLDEGGVYDLITLNLTLHDVCSSESCRGVLGRILQALEPAGTLLVSEIPYPESIRSYREGTFSQLLSGIELHLAMAGCGMITQKQLRIWLEESGFENVRTVPQPNPARFVMLGEKPANG